MNDQDVQFVRAVLARLPEGEPFNYFRSLRDERIRLETVETTDDTIIVGTYSIRRYTDTELRRTIRGEVAIDRDYYEVAVETTIPSCDRWEPDGADIYMIDAHCRSLADAVGRMVTASVEDMMRNLIIAEAEATAAAYTFKEGE